MSLHFRSRMGDSLAKFTRDEELGDFAGVEVKGSM